MRRERGMVTAELAVIMPFGVAFAFLLLWVISLGITEVRLVDASREAARMIARGDPVETAVRAAKEDAPDDAKVTTTTSNPGFITVTVTARSAPVIPFFSGVGARTLKATAVAADESP